MRLLQVQGVNSSLVKNWKTIEVNVNSYQVLTERHSHNVKIQLGFENIVIK